MALCACCSKVSTADSLVLGAIQIMIGVFSVFMWHLLLILYIGQIKGVFGTYEPITYKTGCSVWGIIHCAVYVKLTQHCKLYFNKKIVLIFTKDDNARCLPIFWFQKLGREISRVLLGLYPLELCIAFTYTIFGCVGLMPQSQMDKRKSRKQQEKNDFMCSVTTITADSSETVEA
ncbi:hypothetical protein DBR06_SOUSAS6910001 [Sousa chinensis]|nr:hypothetical protein DBR06_SOUSAS6910001 [Sousa chinensis]